MSLLDAVIETAKETMLEQGEHIPTLYIEYKNSKALDLCVIAGMPEIALDRQKYLFAAGRALGLEHKGREVNTIFFAHEAWMASYELDKPRPYAKPSDDPNRKEILLIEVMDVSTGTIAQSMHTYEILRASDTVDLLPGDNLTKDVHSHLLLSFLAGISSAKMNDREFATFVRKHSEEK